MMRLGQTRSWVIVVAQSWWSRRWPVLLALSSIAWILGDYVLNIRLHYHGATGAAWAVSYSRTNAVESAVVVNSIVLATIIAESYERRMDEVWTTCGVDPARFNRMQLCVATGVAVTSLVIATGALAGYALVDGAVNGTVPLLANSAGALPPALRAASLDDIVAVAVGCSYGWLVGSLARSRAAAVAITVGMNALGIVCGGLQGSLVAIKYLYCLVPVGASATFLGTNINTKPSAVAQGLSTFVILLPLLTGPFLVSIVRRRRFGTSVASKPSRSRAFGWPLACLLVGGSAVSAGALLPVALRSQVPWPLRPAWRADVAYHRTSADIAREMLTSFRGGHTGRADQFVTGQRSVEALLGPYAPAIRGAKSFSTRIVAHDYGDPGTVYVESAEVNFTLCASRTVDGWRITELRTSTNCPPAKIAIVRSG